MILLCMSKLCRVMQIFQIVVNTAFTFCINLYQIHVASVDANIKFIITPVHTIYFWPWIGATDSTIQKQIGQSRYTAFRIIKQVAPFSFQPNKWTISHPDAILSSFCFYLDSIIDRFHKSQNPPVPSPTMLHSEQKYVHFCSEWSIVMYGTRDSLGFVNNVN